MAAKPEQQPKSDKRLYIGNLSTSVDESVLPPPPPSSPRPDDSSPTSLARRYSLIQLCAKLGRIAKIDYLFHKTGPQKGKPRGYAFVEYSAAEVRLALSYAPLEACARADADTASLFDDCLARQEAKRAQQALHDRLFRGRKMMVMFATEQVRLFFPVPSLTTSSMLPDPCVSPSSCSKKPPR